MPEQVDRRLSFNGGEISPWVEQRIDLDKYRSSCRTLKNFVPTIYGTAMKRQGTTYLGDVKTSSKATRLLPFEFSTQDTLMLEMGEGYIRFWSTGASADRVRIEADVRWRDGDPYVEGDVVTNFSIYYRCLNDHTADDGGTGASDDGAGDNEPGYGTDAGLYWEQMTWATATDYELGDIVEYNGVFHICKEAHTSGTFSTDDGFYGYWHRWTQLQVEVPTPYLESEIFDVQFAQLNDIIYFAHPNHAPRKLSRFSNTEWIFDVIDYEYPPAREINLTTTTLTPSAPTGTGITLEASDNVFKPENVGGYYIIQRKRDEPFETMTPATATAGTDATDALYVNGEWSAQVQSGGSGTGDWTALFTVQRSYDKTNWETIRTIKSSIAEVNQIVSGSELEPCWMRIFFFSEDGSVPSKMKVTIEALDPRHYGIVKITDYDSPVSVTADVEWELADDSPTVDWQEGSWSDRRGFPGAVSIHEERLYWGGNQAQPQTLWGSVINDYERYQLGSNDDMGLEFTLASDQANQIRWIVSQKDLIVGTSGSEWTIKSGDTTTITLTPSNAAARRSTTYGSAEIQATPVNDATLFVQRNGRKMREFVYTFERDNYVSPDLALLAEHMAETAVTQIAVQRNPETIVWAVTSAGQLLGITYERDQGVTAWHEHTTGASGIFESVASVASDTEEEDEVWFVVKRTVDGGTVRYLERWTSGHLDKLRTGTLGEMVYLDAAVVYSGAATDTISGLDHLEGETVSALAAGNLETGLTVTSGEVTLSEEVDTAIVGLDITADLEPTYLAGGPDSIARIGKFRVTRVVADVWQTIGLKVSTDGGTTFQEVTFRDMEDDMDASPPLKTGLIEIPLEDSTSRLASCILRSDQGFPCNLRAIYIRADLNSQ